MFFLIRGDPYASLAHHLPIFPAYRACQILYVDWRHGPLESHHRRDLDNLRHRLCPAATRPTQFLLTWLVIAQLALQAFPSLRFLHRNFLSQVTHRCLNSYYRALRKETVTGRSLRLQTAQLACSLIPAALQNEPVFLSVDDTTVPKFGKKFDAVSVLHDHACHTGKPYVNGHCFAAI